MPNAISDRVAFRYLPEAEWGVIPAAPFRTLYTTQDDIETQYETEESEAVTGDRQVPNMVRVGKEGSGAIQHEFGFGQLDDLLEGAFCGSWSADVLENAGEEKSFALQKELTDIERFVHYTGMKVGEFSLTLAPRARITGSTSFMGKSGVPGTASLGTGAAVAAVENPMMVTSAGLDLRINGSPFGLCTGFSFTIDNSLRMQPALGTEDPIGIGLGRFRPSGELSAYLPDFTLVELIDEDEEFELSLAAEDSLGNEYLFEFLTVKFASLSGLRNQGHSSDVIITLPWTAYRDPEEEITARVTRTAAPTPTPTPS